MIVGLIYDHIFCLSNTFIARLLDTEDPELLRALSRLVDLLTPSMAAEEEPLARRKQELLLNNVSNGVNYSAGHISNIAYHGLCAGFEASVELGLLWRRAVGSLSSC